MSFDFFPNEQDATLRSAMRQPSLQPDPGVWQGFLPGAGSYTMRGLAEVGRAVDLAGSVFPIVADKVTGGTVQQDRYFREHEEVFESAVDHWTPRPGEVGIAGQVAGQLASGLAQAIISPAVLVGTSQLSTAEDLVRQGVDPRTANLVGGIAGTGMAAGVRMPFLGQTAAARIASGVVGNVAQGASVAAASQSVLTGAGYPAQAAQYDPLDVKARTLDALLGAAFGGLAHLQAAPKISPREAAALLVTNQAHHLETTTSPGRPVTDLDATAHVQAVRRAVDQMLRGEPLTVDDVVKDAAFEPDPVYARDHDEVGAEIARLAREEVQERQLLDTRGQSQRFHGTSRPIASLSDEYAMVGDNRNIYGAGFYTTDAIDVSAGYMRKGRGGQPTLYRVEESQAQLFDMDAPLTQRERSVLERAVGDADYAGSDSLILKARTLREWFDEFRGESRNFGLSRNEVQEVFDSIRANLEEQGYRGYRHVGGDKTATAPHEVKIFWYPEQDAKLSEARLGDYLQPDRAAPIEARPAPAARDLQQRPAATPVPRPDLVKDHAENIVEANPDMLIPTGEFAPDGTPAVARAADFLAQADAEAATARRQMPDLFQTAATCLLGAL